MLSVGDTFQVKPKDECSNPEGYGSIPQNETFTVTSTKTQLPWAYSAVDSKGYSWAFKAEWVKSDTPPSMKTLLISRKHVKIYSAG